MPDLPAAQAPRSIPDRTLERSACSRPPDAEPVPPAASRPIQARARHDGPSFSCSPVARATAEMPPKPCRARLRRRPQPTATLVEHLLAIQQPIPLRDRRLINHTTLFNPTTTTPALIKMRALRGLVRPLRDTVDEDGRTALERYVRATYASGRILAWPSQARGLDRLAAGGSFALCTPTGSGKTTVAEIALLAGLFSTDARPDDAPALCLYLVPTRALAAEVENRLSRSLRGVGGRQAIEVTGLYGGTDWGPADVWHSASSPTVLICTQEKAEAVVRYFGSRVVERIRLVVVDEAHEVQERPTSGDSDPHESRALRLELLIARLRARLGTEARFVALSAVARGIQIPLARWISGDADRDPIVIRIGVRVRLSVGCAAFKGEEHVSSWTYLTVSRLS